MIFTSIFTIAIGLHVSSWNAISYKKTMTELEMLHWDFNETCVKNHMVRFSGPSSNFNEGEIRAWNTAILLAVEDGIVPSFIASSRC